MDVVKRLGFVLAASLIFLLGMFVVPRNAKSEAQTLSLSGVVAKAIRSSDELRVTKIDRSIATKRVKESSAGYYPTLDVQLNSEYSRSLQEDEGIASIGDMILTDDREYQTSLDVILQYRLSNIIASAKEVDIRQNEVEIAELTEEKATRELCLEVYDLYEKALRAYRGTKQKEQLLDLYREVYTVQERLYKSGRLDKTELLSTSIKISQAAADLHALQRELQMVLDQLSYYTLESYQAKTVEMSQLSDFEFDPPERLRDEETAEYRISELQIMNKEKEIDIDKLGMYPQFGLYCKYRLYGADDHEFGRDYEALEAREFVAGLFVSMNLFEGFQYRPRRERLRLERQRLWAEKDQRVRKLKVLYEELKQAIFASREEIEAREILLGEMQDELRMVERLIESRVVATTELYRRKELLMNTVFDLETVISENRFNILRAGTILQRFRYEDRPDML